MVERERYAVVSCHVERLLDDRVWERFLRLQDDMPSGFRIAAFLRPPDIDGGESADRWVERARAAAARGPLGHHTHWGGVAHARPRDGGPAERVRTEAEWLRAAGFEPKLFCGGGWYIDADVAAAAAELGYADCTATAFTPRYLDAGAPRLDAEQPCWLELPSGRRLLELPTTHSLGMLARSVVSPSGPETVVVHAYFHDTDLLDRTRATALRIALAALARRRRSTDLTDLRARAERAQLPLRSAFAR
jgi:hypothetical protein